MQQVFIAGFDSKIFKYGLACKFYNAQNILVFVKFNKYSVAVSYFVVITRRLPFSSEAVWLQECLTGTVTATKW